MDRAQARHVHKHRALQARLFSGSRFWASFARFTLITLPPRFRDARLPCPRAAIGARRTRPTAVDQLCFSLGTDGSCCCSGDFERSFTHEAVFGVLELCSDCQEFNHDSCQNPETGTNRRTLDPVRFRGCKRPEAQDDGAPSIPPTHERIMVRVFVDTGMPPAGVFGGIT